MSDQHAQTWSDQPAKPASNPLGIVGFIFAFCISPLGLLLSLVALAWRPRGFAVAGVIVGLIGTVIWGILGTMGWFGRQGFMFIAEYEAISRSIESYSSAHNGELPPDLATAGITGDLTLDPWGKEYRYQPAADGTSWTLTSAAYDGQFDTKDDGVLWSTMSDSQRSEAIQRMISGHFDPNAKGPLTPPSAAPPSEKPAEKPAESPATNPK